MGKLLAWRDTFYDAELAEARASQSRPHGKLDGDARRGQCCARTRRNSVPDYRAGTANLIYIDPPINTGKVSRVLGDETVAAWLDTYRGLGFEAMLRREATTEELEALRRSPTLQLLLSVEKEGQC